VGLFLKKKTKKSYGWWFSLKLASILWLVVQPKAGKHYSQGRWQFPKGLIEKGEKAKETARREVEEETGFKAEVLEKVDSLNIFFYDEEKNRVFKTISLFLMGYRGKGRKQKKIREIDKVVWLPYEQACKSLTFENEKKALKKAKEILEERKKQLALV